MIFFLNSNKDPGDVGLEAMRVEGRLHDGHLLLVLRPGIPSMGSHTHTHTHTHTHINGV
jgi:hypothetical protein